MREEPEHLEKLWSSTYTYKKMLKDLGIDFWNSQTPSVPLLMNTKEEAYFFWKYLKDNGVYSIISIPPAVPAGKNLVRTAISARHTSEDLEKVYDVLKKAVKAVL
jgi:7-keto-8-aminopelargonate synthetase-like enzyme